MKPFFTSFFVTLVVLCLMFGICLATSSGEGIHPVSSNAVIIEVECLTVNWDATDDELRLAVNKFKELRTQKKRKESL